MKKFDSYEGHNVIQIENKTKIDLSQTPMAFTTANTLYCLIIITNVLKNKNENWSKLHIFTLNLTL